MKQAICLIISCLFVVTSHVTHGAQDAPSFTIGGIKSGSTFTMKVVDRTYTPQGLAKWMPKLKKGEKVKFKIGKKGQLILPAKGYTFKFAAGSNIGNVYSNGQKGIGTRVLTSHAELAKGGSGGRPRAMVIRLTDTDFAGTAYFDVIYRLE